MILALSNQQRVGAVVVGLLLVGWLAYIVVQLRRPKDEPVGAEIELAPNRKPYYDDETLEGPKLDRSLGAALTLLTVVAIGLPLYWLREPSRQEGAERGFDNRAVKRGSILFLPTDAPVHGAKFGCATCHGNEGVGGVVDFVLTDPADPEAPPRVVQWQAPALNTVLLRYSPDEVRKILVYGRAGTPMPAWGIEGGGPMNAQQIDDLIAYMQSIQLDPKEVQAANEEEFGRNGRALFEAQCARCHTKGWSYGEPDVMGGGAFGPNLTNGATLRQFPSADDMVEFIATGTEYGKQYGVRGVGGDESGGMPGFGKMLTKEQIEAIVRYVRGL